MFPSPVRPSGVFLFGRPSRLEKKKKKKGRKSRKKGGWRGLTQQLNKLFYLESGSHNQTGLKGKLQAHEGGLVSPSSNIFNLGG